MTDTQRGWVGRAFMVFCLLTIAAAATMVWWAQRWYFAEQPNLGHQIIVLEPGTNYTELIGRLQAQGRLSDPWMWRLLGRIDDRAGRVRAGEYRLPGAVSPADLIGQLTAGGGVVRYGVTLVEGWTSAQAVAYLQDRPALRGTLADVPADRLLQHLGLEPGPSEGRFFPDTYSFERGATDADILRQAHRRMEETLAREWAARDQALPYDSPYEALIMASIIEKETGRAEERGQIAQVFVQRLRVGMKLQTDPTVIYGVGAAFDGDLTRAHLRTDTPFNTYTRFGLPPTPIALPGRAALRAALQPDEGDYLYFVARGDGSSQFSRTLAEHQAAVRRYQLGR